MAYRICTIGGDGIGREVTPAAVDVLRATGLAFEFTDAPAGWECFEQMGDALPAETLEAVKSADATLFGAITSPTGPRPEGYRSPILTLRQELGLYANLRPARSWPVASSRAGVDMLIVRENTEGLYVRRESREGDTATAERRITREASTRIGRAACRLAMGRRRRLTIVHKANVLPVTCGLFRDSVRAAAEEFEELTIDEMLVDAMAMRLVKDPEHFDVIVTTNMFGDILSDEAAAVCGGMGLAPSANIGPRSAVFEPVHGSAPDIAGQGIANPIAAILSASMMLDYLGEQQAAGWLIAGCELAMRDGIVPPDLGGEANTAEVTAVIADVVRRLREREDRAGGRTISRPASSGGTPPAAGPHMQCAADRGPSTPLRYHELEVIQDDGLLLEPLPEAETRRSGRRRQTGHATRHHSGRRLELR
jgi:homoisocitrate dehydrogenase